MAVSLTTFDAVSRPRNTHWGYELSRDTAPLAWVTLTQFIAEQREGPSGEITMGDFDPVPWETREAVLGPPAPEITEAVERMRDDVRGAEPYVAVKTIHDRLYEIDRDRTVSSFGEPFVTAYLLEKEGIIAPGEDDAEPAYRSLVERRPSRERLRELFWEEERTLWWIGVLTGVHPSLVTYWFYEYDVPLMERNYSEEALEEIEAYRESGSE